MKIIKYICIILIVAGFSISCTNKNKDKRKKVLVYSAASLTEVIQELADSFEVKYNVKVVLNLASSGTLARQMEQAELPDVYLSASIRWANYANDLGVVVPGMQQKVAQNQLVLIAPVQNIIRPIKIDATTDFLPMLQNSKLAMGDPKHVPAGKYALQSLEYYNQYEILKKHILPTKDVRSALMVVELGEATLGLVYKTDALKSKKVSIVGKISPEAHEPIKYIASLCKNRDVAKQFYAYLASENAKTIWLKYGFIK